MSFAEYYILKERFKPSNDDRFLALAIDETTWNKYISDLTYVWEINQIYQPLRFVISNKSGSLVTYLDWDYREKIYKYHLEKSSIAELNERGMIKNNPEQIPWAYYDVDEKNLIISGETERRGRYNHPLYNSFKKEKLQIFLEDLFIVNQICEAKGKFSLIYVLYFIDKLSLEDSQKIKRNNKTPDWVEYALKGDESRNRESGLFKTLFR